MSVDDYFSVDLFPVSAVPVRLLPVRFVPVSCFPVFFLSCEFTPDRSGGLKSQATDFRAGHALTGPGAGGPHCRATDFVAVAVRWSDLMYPVAEPCPDPRPIKIGFGATQCNGCN